jgi:RNA-binding protein YhbY
MAQTTTHLPQRKDTALMHCLNAVVMIGSDDDTSVQKEIDAALNAHGLIKVRCAIRPHQPRADVQTLAAGNSTLRHQHIDGCWCCGVANARKRKSVMAAWRRPARC